jgi:serine phosphatase RsbU (regulator of sigma subunit)
MAELRAEFRRHPVRNGYLAVLGAFALAAVLAREAARGSDAAALLVVFTCLAAVPLAFWSVRWVWRKVTYRVGVRLSISYLLIGLTPFLLMAILAALAGYILVGQYGSMRLGQELDALGGQLAVRVAAAVQELGATGPQPAAVRVGAPVGAKGSRFTWVLAQGRRVWRSQGGQDLPVPVWAQEGSWRGTVVVGKALAMAAIERRADTIAALLVPLDAANAPTVVQAQWLQARFATGRSLAKVAGRKERPATVTISQSDTTHERVLRVGGEIVPPEEIEPGWLGGKESGATGAEPHGPSVAGDRWRRMQVTWLRVLEAPRNWSDGSSTNGMHAGAVMKVSLGGAADDFFAGTRKMGGEVRTALTASTLAFGVIYLIALSFAGVMILSVARSTARLTRGARAVARGDLDHRIPVKRSDQLGDLAVSFNSMTESVRTMLLQVAESERMAREVELAREIQESLLPPSELSSGPLSVWAHFRPATEVGGDYFDLFPLSPSRLVVAVGDVAGHGLHTGLLMAMVKSAVATLVQEGHTGHVLLERLNQLLLGQPIRHRMVSLALAEIDAPRGTIEVTSAGHPPGMLLANEGEVEELLLSSLPLGHRWPEPPPSHTREFAPGSRLLLYSDGLVEARSADGRPFGYEPLREVLRIHRGAPGSTLIGAVLAALDQHLAGQPLTDDLTLLLVEHRTADPGNAGA